MNERIGAIVENGMFRPDVPVNIADGERVTLSVQSASGHEADGNDLDDLLDTEFMASCRQHAENIPTLEAVRNVLSAFGGSLADRISEERDER